MLQEAFEGTGDGAAEQERGTATEPTDVSNTEDGSLCATDKGDQPTDGAWALQRGDRTTVLQQEQQQQQGDQPSEGAWDRQRGDRTTVLQHVQSCASERDRDNMPSGEGHHQPSSRVYELCNRMLLAWACRREGWDRGICQLAPEHMSLPDTDVVNMALAQLRDLPEAQQQLREHVRGIRTAFEP